ncbi:hypothetical protein B0I33_104490 [Prauserella shujinwangii]|uniref:Uncharacterized protein n=1 Tax=Prauserella shujinwangii TaxID=1453103 RepID=A0A2T0LXC4_9PSEU|nr:hypothetical protein B0I33_104490 [Prauserella shujinwangii]
MGIGRAAAALLMMLGTAALWILGAFVLLFIVIATFHFVPELFSPDPGNEGPRCFRC